VEQLATKALSYAVDSSIGMNPYEFFTVLLVDVQSGTLCYELADCDDINRSILNELYQLSHVGPATVSQHVRTDWQQAHTINVETVNLPSPHGFTFREYKKETGDSLLEKPSFHVICWEGEPCD
jgi:hypothetical protein